MVDFTLQYLDDIPGIPDEFIPSIYQSLEGKDFFVWQHNTTYKIFPSAPPLSIFTRKLLFNHTNDRRWGDGSKSVVAVQSLNPGTGNIHRDVTRTRAYNYIIDCGGENVSTCFYNPDGSVLEEHIIEPRRWHLLNVDVLHNVKNVETKRVAVTAFLKFMPNEQLVRTLEISNQ